MKIDLLEQGLALELSRADRAIQNLRDEALPHRALDTLPDWEDFSGVPAATTIAARHAAQQAAGQGAVTPNDAFFQELVANFGYEDVVVTHSLGQPFIAGVSVAGDPLGGGYGPFMWSISVAASIDADTDAAMEAAVTRYVPRHTFVSYEYGA
jgi:uncharacterized protein YmfQ (DUF2313 family)